MPSTIAKPLGMSVLEAARKRIVNLYRSDVKVYLNTSGGKDSIVLMSLIYDLAKRGEIDLSNTEVVFIDEEAMFDCVIEIVAQWRKRFLSLGAKFTWFCLEVKHFNCLNSVTEDETFICWDRRKRDVWVREMPPFAVSSNPLLNPRKDSYQTFLDRYENDGVTMIGLRISESIQRRQSIARALSNPKISKVFPLYDWRDKDIFKYILDHKLEIPEVYQFMWETGTPKNKLRISQFFSVDTARVLVNLYEYYPDLAERVQRREPNSYLVRLYWDTEMFRRNTKNRREAEGDRDYKALVLKMLSNIEKNFPTEVARKNAYEYRRHIASISSAMNHKTWKMAYDALLAGDPKNRTLRALLMSRD